MNRRRELGQPRGAEGAPSAPPIGAETLDIRRYVVDLSTARELVKLPLGGSFLWAIDGVGADATLDVRFNESLGDAVPFRVGQVVRGHRFHALYLSNAAQTGAELTLLLSMSSRLDVENAVRQLAATLELPSIIATARVEIDAAAETLLSAASSSKRRVHVISETANTADLYVGPTGITTATGFGPIAPGDYFEIETTAALYGRVGSDDQFFRVLSETL